MAMSAMSYVDEIPLRYDDVFGRDDEGEWRKAIESELKSLEENDTWEIVSKPKDVKLLGTRWVFKIKDDPSGVKYKARLVVRGFEQRQGIDFHDTYAPVARLPTIRMILALAVRFDLKIRHLDVTTAFLYGKLDEEVYLKTPDGVDIGENQTLKLKRSLYGLRQSPKCWNNRFHEFVITLGFKQSKSEYCLYTKHENESLLYLVLYVDDVLLATNDEKLMSDVIEKLSDEFKMKDLGVVKRFMGINIEIDSGTITLDQTHYVQRILEKFGMTDCKPIKTPIEPNLHLERGSSEPTDKPYRELIGSLMFLTLGTRPDLSFATSYLSRYQEGATEEHFNYLKRVLRYLRGTSELKLVYKSNENSQPISSYVDSDYAGSIEDRKSTTGFIVMVYNCPIMWASKKQPIVSLSSTEAEFVAANYAACEVIWLRKIFKDLSIEIPEPTVLYEDNQGAIAMSKNSETRRTKHMDVRYNFLRECVQDEVITLKYVQTNHQLADLMTKGLPRDRFEMLRKAVLSGSVGDT